MRNFHFLSFVVSFIFAIAVPRFAQAQSIVITDFYGQPDVRSEAAAVTIIFRSEIEAETSKIVSRDAMAEAIKKVTGKPASYALLVEANKRAELLSTLKGSVLVFGTVSRQGTQLLADAGIVTSKAPNSPMLVKVTAAHGQIAQLAHGVALRLAKELGLSFRPDPPQISYGQILPYVDASQALLAAQPEQAANALRVADPRVAQQLRTAQALAKSTWSNTNLPLGNRVIAALTARESKAVFEMASTVLKSNPARDDANEAIAAMSLAYMSEGDLNAAEEELKKIKVRGKRQPLVMYAQAQLLDFRNQPEERDKILLQLIQQDNYLPAVNFIAQLAPSAPSDALIKAAYSEAKLLNRDQHAPIVGAIALRAALRAKAVNVDLKETIDLIRVDALRSDDVQWAEEVARSAIKSKIGAGFRLRAEIGMLQAKLQAAEADLQANIRLDPNDLKARLYLGRVLSEKGDYKGAAVQFEAASYDNRMTTKLEYSRSLTLSGDTKQAKAVETDLAADPLYNEASSLSTSLNLDAIPPSGSGDSKDSPAAKALKMEALSRELQRFINAFPRLAEGVLSDVIVSPLDTSGESLFSTRTVDEDLLSTVLVMTLKTTYGIRATPNPQRVSLADLRSPAQLSALGFKGTSGGILLYDLSAKGSDALLHLVLYDRETKRGAEFEETIDGPYGLVGWNPLFVGIIGSVILLVVGWISYVSWRGTGDVRVKVNLDKASDQQIFCLHIDKNENPPSFKDPEAYFLRLQTQGPKQTKYTSTIIRNFCRFKDIPSGRYYIHIYGMYTKAGKRRQLPSNLSQQIVVAKGATAEVVFDLEPNAVELQVSVFDDQETVAGAVLWLSDAPKKQMFTNAQGQILIQVPRGKQVTLHIKARDVETQRQLQFQDTKVHTLTLNLKKERRMTDMMTHGISLDAAPSIPNPPTAPAFGQGTFQGDPNAAISMGNPAIDGTIPMGGKAPPPVGGSSQSGLRRYKQLAELGRGAMGIVYKAQDLVLERVVALKVIGEELKQHPLALEMFLQEAKALAALNHPNVVTVFDQGQDGDQTFMVMEFVEGTTLESILAKRGPLPIPDGLEIADQLCAGLAYAHNRQILHRDIKPENIFVSRDGVAKLGDFGLARVMREMSIQRTEIRGTPLYMAPEQIRGTDIDLRADLYAVGCTMFAIFTGRPPFIEGEVLYHHMHTPPPKPSEFVPEIPQELDALILQCIAKEKEDRVASADEIRKRLKPIVARFYQQAATSQG